MAQKAVTNALKKAINRAAGNAVKEVAEEAASAAAKSGARKINRIDKSFIGKAGARISDASGSLLNKGIDFRKQIENTLGKRFTGNFDMAMEIYDNLQNMHPDIHIKRIHEMRDIMTSSGAISGGQQEALYNELRNEMINNAYLKVGFSVSSDGKRIIETPQRKRVRQLYEYKQREKEQLNKLNAKVGSGKAVNNAPPPSKPKTNSAVGSGNNPQTKAMSTLDYYAEELAEMNPSPIPPPIPPRNTSGKSASSKAGDSDFNKWIPTIVGGTIIGGGLVAYLDSRRHGRSNRELYGQ